VTALVLTYREAAKLLRVDRGATLHALIDAGHLRPVPWGEGRRIPLEQVQQLARTGFTVNGKPARAVSRPRRAGPTGGVGSRIRAIEVTP
jgi:excisionase family DNA binding protein